MLLRDALTQRIISRGDIVIYQWRKEEKKDEGLLAKTRQIDYFAAFMVETIDGDTIHDRLGIFPHENIVAVFKPPMGRRKAILLWPQVQERMYTDTVDSLIHRLLDVFHEGVLFRDDKYVRVGRAQSVMKFRTTAIDLDLVQVAEEARDREDNLRMTDAGEELARRLNIGKERR